MFKWLNNLIDSNEREINRFRPMAARVNELEPEMQGRSDEELRAFVAGLKEELAGGRKDLDDALPQAFAAVREAAVRTIGQRHYDVQLMGGMVLHEGKIAEMRTGEGKTLVATLPTTLNALAGAGVHVVTVNDYLAKRDAQWMGPVYHMLGLSVACIQHEMAFEYDPSYTVEDPRYTHLRPLQHRREAYLADITYGTNNEFGFDYLRDNMVVDLIQCVQRPLNYAIVDEVDNILIDEARTPLIISGAASESAEDYHSLAKLVPRLRMEEDYTVDEKTRAVTLTEHGTAKLEDLLQVPNLYDPEHYRMLHFVETAVKALVLYKRDRDYIVKDDQVIIVDEFTGRQMPGRRWSDGLHQAVEAKEGLQVQRENLTLATITFQNYFRLYNKLAGMTGTAVTEAEEFHKIYKLDVVVVPTHRPMVRQDNTDLVYKAEDGKFEAVVEEIKDLYEMRRPVLVGTVTIEKSERISDLLRREGIPHEVLNAKFHEREAAIVAQAGRAGAVTIATNMAGRGTDILLGGNPDGLALDEALQRGIDPEGQEEEYQQILQPLKAQCDQDRAAVVEVGGLHIIGTERHEARRIDNQLRGRAGRQGDPGSSRFYVSLEDDIMRRFGGDRIKQVMEWAGLEDDVPIENNLVTKSLENAQVKVEAYNFDIRKHLVEYDDVMNTQRITIYGERRKVLEGADLRSNIQEMVRQELDELIEVHLQARESEDWDIEGLFTELGTMLPPIEGFTMDEARGMTKDEIREVLLQHVEAIYLAREQELGGESMRVLERLVMLRTIDTLWVEHLTTMEDMRQGIGLRAYAQTDPLVAYKREAFEMFQLLRDNIRHNVARTVFRVNLVREPAPAPLVQNVQTNREEAAQPVAAGARPASGPRQPVASGAANGSPARKVGRNDPCWCGSGKKYKRCHGA